MTNKKVVVDGFTSIMSLLLWDTGHDIANLSQSFVFSYLRDFRFLHGLMAMASTGHGRQLMQNFALPGTGRTVVLSRGHVIIFFRVGLKYVRARGVSPHDC